MPSIDVIFTRKLLSLIAPHVRLCGYRTMKDAWVWQLGRDWEFHGPGKFFWYGRAANAYEARYKGWSAFIEKYHPDVFANMEKDAETV